MTFDNDAERLARIRNWMTAYKEHVGGGWEPANDPAGGWVPDTAFLLRLLDSRDAALRRLASMQAFVVSRVIDPRQDEELLARIQFADDALSGRSQPATPSSVPIQQQDIGSSVMPDGDNDGEQPSPETEQQATALVNELLSPHAAEVIRARFHKSIVVALSAARAAGIERAAQIVRGMPRDIDAWTLEEVAEEIERALLPPSTPETKP